MPQELKAEELRFIEDTKKEMKECYRQLVEEMMSDDTRILSKEGE